jgi:hypothetical protein
MRNIFMHRDREISTYYKVTQDYIRLEFIIIMY